MTIRPVLASLALALPLLSPGLASANVKLVPGQQPTVTVEGTSTVRAYRCEAKGVKLSAAGTSDSIAEAIPDLVAGSLELQVNEIDCDNNTMNDHLRTAMKAKDHPTIRFSLEREEKGAAQGDGVAMKLHGKLLISGQTRPVVVTGVATADGDGQMRFRGSHKLNMTEWDVTPPRLMLGTLRVGEEVTISYDVLLARQ